MNVKFVFRVSILRKNICGDLPSMQIWRVCLFWSLVQIYCIRYLFTISNPIQPPCLSKLWYKLRTKWRNVWSIKGGNLEWFGEGVMFCPKYYIYSKHRVRLIKVTSQILGQMDCWTHALINDHKQSTLLHSVAGLE